MYRKQKHNGKNARKHLNSYNNALKHLPELIFLLAVRETESGGIYTRFFFKINSMYTIVNKIDK